MQQMATEGVFLFDFGNDGAAIIIAGFFGPANVDPTKPYDNRHSTAADHPHRTLAPLSKLNPHVPRSCLEIRKVGVLPKDFTIVDFFQVSPVGKAKNFDQLLVPGFIKKHPEICQVFAQRLLLQVEMAVEVSSVLICSMLMRDMETITQTATSWPMETNPNCHLEAHLTLP